MFVCAVRSVKTASPPLPHAVELQPVEVKDYLRHAAAAAAGSLGFNHNQMLPFNTVGGNEGGPRVELKKPKWFDPT